MSIENQATPRPWKTGNTLIDMEFKGKMYYVTPVQSNHHATAPGTVQVAKTFGCGNESAANAALIVRAVNSFDLMVKTLRQFVTERERGAEWESDDTLDMAVNALAAAQPEGAGK